MSVVDILTTWHAQRSDVTSGPHTNSVVNVRTGFPPEWYGVVYIIHSLPLEAKEFPTVLREAHVIISALIIYGSLKRIFTNIPRQIGNII